jgi:hypothetical protein
MSNTQQVRRLIQFYDESEPWIQESMGHVLVTAHNALRAQVLKEFIGPNDGLPMHMHRAKTRYLTGADPVKGARCEGITKSGDRCKNPPYIGKRHCHLHASDFEVASARRDTYKWEFRWNKAVRDSGLGSLMEALTERYERK